MTAPRVTTTTPASEDEKKIQELLKMADEAEKAAKERLQAIEKKEPLTDDDKKKIAESLATTARPVMKYLILPATLIPMAAGGLVVAMATTALPLAAGIVTLGGALYSAGRTIALLSSNDFEKKAGEKFLDITKAQKEPLTPAQKDTKYFLKSALGLGLSLAKIGTSVALFSLAPAGAAVLLFGALGIFTGISGFFGTLLRTGKMIADVKQKIESSFLKDLPKEDAPDATVKPSTPDVAPAAVSGLKSENAFNAAAQASTNDNAQQPVSKPEPKKPAA